MSGKVAEIFVVVQAEIANCIVDFGRAVNGGRVAMCKMNEINAVLLRVDRSCCCAFLAVVENNLIVVAAAKM